jgi:hypothetical protein
MVSGIYFLILENKCKTVTAYKICEGVSQKHMRSSQSGGWSLERWSSLPKVHFSEVGF